MTNKVILVCGVSGSGKTWVAKQLTDKFSYISHDEFREGLPEAIKMAAQFTNKPIITECPFAERVLKEKLEADGFDVTPVFVVEPVGTVKARYFSREKKELPKAAVTRAITIRERVKEWGAKAGTSQEILEYLKGL